MQKLMIWAIRCGQSTPKVLAISLDLAAALLRHQSEERSRRVTCRASLHEEEGVEHDRFREGDGQNRLHQNRRRRAGIASHRFRAFMPMKPTPRAAPSAARPTCRWLPS